MRVLITGAAGFVGPHLARELAASGHEPWALVLPGETPPPGLPAVAGSVASPDDLRRAFEEARPQGCVHLAGITFVPAVRDGAAAACEVNVVGTLRLLEAAQAFDPAPRTLVVSTAQIYGGGPWEGPLDEDAPMRPAHLYALTKMAADLGALLFHRDRGVPVMTARPVNHTGPGQAGQFVVASFAAQLAEMAAGRRPPEMRVGNLDSRRDFLDVRDVVRAYRLLLERGRPGLAYNIGSGRLERIGRLLELLSDIAGIRPRLVSDPALHRPTDSMPVLDCRRLARDTGWTQEIGLEQTLRDVYRALA